MSEAMNRVLGYLGAFCRSIERYKEKKNEPVEGKDLRIDAYETLYRLTERIKKEIDGLEKEERGICHEILDDKYLAGLGGIRTIAAHVTNDTCNETGVKMYLPSGVPLIISAETSANAFFSGNIVTVYSGSLEVEPPHSIDHLKNLETARDRIKKIFGKLK